jgi:PAS domain S-box-containing protein
MTSDKPTASSPVHPDHSASRSARSADDDMLRLALDAAGQGAFSYDFNLERAIWDDQAYRLFGVPIGAELNPERLIDAIVHPDDRESVRVALDAAADPEGDGGFAIDIRVIHPDGGVHWLAVHARTTFEGAGRARRAVRMHGVVRDVTDVRTTLEALAAREAQLRRVFDGIDEGYCVCEMVIDEQARAVDYRFLEANPLFRSMTGLAEPVGKTALQLVPDLERHWIDAYARVGLDGETLRFQLSSDAMGRVFDVFATPIEPKGCFALVFRDVTDRRRAEDALRASEERMQRAAEAGRLAPFEVTAPGAGGEALAPEAFRLLYGLPPSARLDLETVLQTIHPDDRDRYIADHAHLARQGGPFEAEFRVVWPDGQVRWLQARGEAEPGPDGFPRRLVGVNLDVTDRKRAEEALRESEARFRLLADQTPIMIWVVDPDLQCTFLNKRWVDFTGQSLEEGLGFGWLDIVHDEDRAPSGRIFQEAARERQTFKLDYRLRRADGVYVWMVDEGHPRFGADGRFLGYIGSVTDIDERKKAEQHRKLLIDELNHRVRNTMTVIQSIAHQTFRGDAAKPEARDAFLGRLAAVADANGVLTRADWKEATLAELAASALHASGADPARVTIEGPAVHLKPRQAVSIAMALHELFTNAIKHGALSNDGGRIAINWTLEPGEPPMLSVLWRESGGPPVDKPTRRGFGSMMIERALAEELQGKVALDFRPEGLVCTIAAPAPR